MKLILKLIKAQKEMHGYLIFYDLEVTQLFIEVRVMMPFIYSGNPLQADTKHNYVSAVANDFGGAYEL